jgi:hypothetical protein
MIAAAGLILALNQGAVDQPTRKTTRPPEPESPPTSPWTVTLNGERACAYPDWSRSTTSKRARWPTSS